VWGIAADANCEGHFQFVLRLLHDKSRREFWHFLNLAVVTFEDLEIPATASDRVVWEKCQEQQVLLITANRNATGPDSLEAVIQSSNQPNSLPVITLANAERIRRDRAYAGLVADRVLDVLFDVENLRGVGRLFVP
jgi:hypothetical protein